MERAPIRTTGLVISMFAFVSYAVAEDTRVARPTAEFPGWSREVTRERLHRRPAFHPLYRPRAEITAPQATRPVDTGLLPRTSHEPEEPNDRLLRAWERRPSTESMRRRIAQALALPSAPGTTSPAIYGWAQIGNGIDDPLQSDRTGRATSAQFAYDDDGPGTTLYIGSLGGVWKISGGSWISISDNLPGSPAVGAFLVHPNDSDRILIASGDAYRGAGSGMYRTEDGGDNWVEAPIADVPDAFYALDYDYTSPNLVIAASSTGIWRSVNFGDTWTRVTATPTSDIMIDAFTPQYWYAGAPGIGVLESSDNGVTWSPIAGTGGIPGWPVIRRVSLTQCDAAPNYIYALVETTHNGLASGNVGSLRGVYRTADYGLTWDSIETTDMISSGQGFHAHAIEVDPIDPNRLFAGMTHMQWTANATAPTPCWTRGIGVPGCAACGYPCIDHGHADHTSFTVVPDAIDPGNTEIVLTNDGGVYLYDWATGAVDDDFNRMGMNLQQVTWPGHTLTSWYRHPRYLMSGLQDNGIVVIDTEAPQDKLVFRGGGDGMNVSISPDVLDNVAFSSGLGWGRFVSDDHAIGWDVVDCGIPYITRPLMMLDPTPAVPETVVAGGNDSDSEGYLYQKPFSSVCDWFKINANDPIPGKIRIADQANNNLHWIYYATLWWDSPVSSTGLYVLDSSEHGFPGSMGWEERTPPLPTLVVDSDAAAFADRSVLQPQTVYYTTGFARPSRAFLSIDAGRTWEDVTGNLVADLPDATYHELIGNPSNLDVLFLATDVGVFATEDRGTTWVRYMTGLPEVVNAMAIDLNHDNASTPMLRIGTYGRGYWERGVDLGTGLWIGTGPDPRLWVDKIWIDSQETLDPADHVADPEPDFVGFIVGDRESQQDYLLQVGKAGGDELLLLF